MSLAEVGLWLMLLAPRQTSQAHDNPPARQQKATTLILADRKAEGGCLRTASQLLMGPDKAGPTSETLHAVGNVARIECTTSHRAAKSECASIVETEDASRL